MLTQLEAAGGVGKQVHFAARLNKVSPAPAVSPSASTLSFANGKSVTASKVILNMPGNAIEGLDPASTIFTGSANATKLLDSVYTFGMNKVYAWYEDAWWNSKLKLMEGYFTGHGGPTHKFAAPLEGRYHDGPQRCVIGKDTAGLPVYSGDKIQGGNCSGALEVYYGGATPYYEKLQSTKLQPLTVVTKDDVEETRKQLMSDVHAHLMSHHASKFNAAGIDPSTISPPTTVVLANWIADGEFTPGIGHLFPATDAARKVVRKPVPAFDIFVVNQDYGCASRRHGSKTSDCSVARHVNPSLFALSTLVLRSLGMGCRFAYHGREGAAGGDGLEKAQLARYRLVPKERLGPPVELTRGGGSLADGREASKSACFACGAFSSPGMSPGSGVFRYVYHFCIQ